MTLLAAYLEIVAAWRDVFPQSRTFHEKLMELLERRIADQRILRLIQKWLKAGVSEEGQWSETKVGTPQGAVISPLLANIYLHYVLDQWVAEWRKESANGDVILVRKDPHDAVN